MVLALVIVAIILFILAAFAVPSGRVGLGWLGMAFWVLSTIINKF
jgi:hypothetical protein